MSESPKASKSKKRILCGSRAKSVAIYLAALFLIALLLLVLAYFMQERALQSMAAVVCFT